MHIHNYLSFVVKNDNAYKLQIFCFLKPEWCCFSSIIHSFIYFVHESSFSCVIPGMSQIFKPFFSTHFVLFSQIGNAPKLRRWSPWTPSLWSMWRKTVLQKKPACPLAIESCQLTGRVWQGRLTNRLLPWSKQGRYRMLWLCECAGLGNGRFRVEPTEPV